jgi:thiol-disulfide isomerase/thioredoxin
VIDPQARLDALLAASPGTSRWERGTYWGALSEAAHSVGDPDLELDALDHLIDVMPRSDIRLRFAELAAEHDTRLRAARRQAARVVRDREEPPVVGEDPTATAEGWRTGLADALAVQATVLQASGRTDQAQEALARSLVLDPDHPDRLLALGLLYHELDWSRQAVAPLARGLARTRREGDDVEQAWAALDAALDAQGLWVPGGAVAFVDAQHHLRAPSDDDPDEGLDGSRFDDLVVQIDGEDVRLLDIEGPLVVDVWATWCGPCMQSLPHLDGLARQYDGRVTMLALSVDDELAKVDAYLSARGTPAFQVGWAGADAMAEMGIDGIPAMFVFDDQHRLVARLGGWGPGNRQLDRAIERMLR